MPVDNESDDRELCDCGGDRDDCIMCYGCGYCCTEGNISDSDGDIYCPSCYDEHYFDCADCREETARDPYSVYENLHGERICEDCDEDYRSCYSCDRRYHIDNMVYSYRRSEWFCQDCDTPETYDGLTLPRRADDTFDIIGSTRTFGLELETSDCDGYKYFYDQYHFGAKHDGSIRGMEFVSTVLHGDRGLDAVEDFCNAANRAGFEVDSTCGYHLHIGCRDLSDGQLYAVCAAYALLEEVFQSFVPESRRNNSYCGSLEWSADDAAAAWNDGESFRDFANKDRYQWFNVSSYLTHHTLEVRLHTGTLNADKANNWVKLHTRFVDAVAGLSIAEVMRRFSGDRHERFAALARIIGVDLARFYRARAAEFGAEYVEPRQRLLFAEIAA